MEDRKENTIFTDLLRELDVPFTPAYSQKQFDGMPFPSLFGLGKLLKSYNVESRGIRLANPAGIAAVPVPFIARMTGGLVIVTAIDDDRIDYLSQGMPESMPLDEFVKLWDGVAFQAFPGPGSAEPDYATHRFFMFVDKAKHVLLWVGLALLFLYLFVTGEIWRHVSTVLLTLLDLAGLYLCYLLVQKSLNIHNPHADRVCGVIQEGGCDKVLETKASTFFGIFSWSEVGFAYFSVSLLCLLMFPQYAGYLALCNVCCLPFSFWSVWYQKYRAHHWCTLCLGVQTTLWLLFFCYLGGGWLRDAFPLRIELAVLILTYGTVLLALNRILPRFTRPKD